jgi:hypothetical protein
MFDRVPKHVAAAAVIAGLGLGSYGIAAAASGSSSSSSTTAAAPTAPPGAPAQNRWGHQRGDETPLTGDALTQVRAAALARVGSGASIVRIETDADGHAAYEAHMLRADGSPVTVYVDTSYDVVGVESR